MRILIVEDNPSQQELLIRLLEQEGYCAEGYDDGVTGLYAMSMGEYDLAVIDRLLPELDGIAVLRAYRAGGGTMPVILLTALSSVGDRVTGLDAGADDYLAKPFAPDELLARIRALLRRPAALYTDQCRKGDLVLHRKEGKLEGPGGICSLSRREGALLYLFLSNFGQVLSRQTILLRIWGNDSEVEERNIDNFVFLLRRRLRHVKSALQIHTVRGFGYRMEGGNA